MLILLAASMNGRQRQSPTKEVRDVRSRAASVHEPTGGVLARREAHQNEGAPAGARGLQFYPARDGSGATCLWEASSADSIQQYVDTTLGDASVNTVYEVDDAQAFAQLPSGIRESAAIGA
jgi:hypothetical protein